VVDLFRAVHTLKGMSATMGYAGVSTLAHAIESVLEPLRERDDPPESPVVEALFRGADALEHAVERAVSVGETISPPGDAPVLAALRAAVPTAPARPSGVLRMRDIELTADAPLRGPGYHVHVELDAECAMPGVRAMLLVRAAERLGAVRELTPSLDELMAAESPVPFTFRLVTDRSAAAIDGRLRAEGDVATVRVQAGLGSGDVVDRRTVRMDVSRLDRLMDLAGELVLARGQLERLTAERADPVLSDSVAAASRLVAAVQHEVLAARLVPVGQVFDRFPRLVRDTAHATGKDVELRLEGRAIELDRSLLDELGEPLVHLLRNAVDHGLETPDERVAAGKPPRGRLTLSALRERSAVLLRVADDGRGIDRERVLAKAKAQGVVDDTVSALDDGALLRVLATPGFSTADQVSSVSGRGVGVDAVQARLRQLGGSLELRSVWGEGTTWTARLPLTLAIVRALLAVVDGATYAIPLTHVREAVDLEDAVRTGEGIVIREQVVPLVWLRAVMQLAAGSVERPQVVVLERGDRAVGVVVDALVGQEEIVVKQIDAVRDAPPLFSGATLLPDGTLALILDVGSLV
jgi:two-component system chemotaxis sensor kinase CheA